MRYSSSSTGMSGWALIAEAIADGIACSNSVPMSLTSAASTTGLSPRASNAVSASERLRRQVNCVRKLPSNADSCAVAP
ncbi:hypothetical protein D3C86_1833060 [compost metagenome]